MNLSAPSAQLSNSEEIREPLREKLQLTNSDLVTFSLAVQRAPPSIHPPPPAPPGPIPPSIPLFIAVISEAWKFNLLKAD